MRIRELFTYGSGLLLLVAFLAAGCSEERKREAAKLENQLRGDTAKVAEAAQPTDSVVRQQSALADTIQPPVTATPATDSTSLQPAVAEHETVATDSTRGAGREETQPVADVNAVPEENGSVAPKTGMPPLPHDGYTIQVGSSLSEAYAQQVAKSFTDRGYQAYVAAVTVEAKTYYRIRVGFYPTTVEAKTALAELKEKFAVEGWIDPVTK